MAFSSSVFNDLNNVSIFFPENNKFVSSANMTGASLKRL